jgi:hypothetical protein
MNLILVHQQTKQDRADYEELSHRIAARRVGIATFIVDTKERAWSDPGFDHFSPTLTVSPMPIKQFVPPWGSICQGCDFPKSEQYERLSLLGLPVPKWTHIRPDTTLDPAEWGPYVVVKPDLGRKGAEIFIKRTGRVRYRAGEAYPEVHPIHKAPLLAQRFIYTGRWPISFRVVTLFGRALMSWCCEANHAYVPLEWRYGFKARGGITVVSNKRDSRYTLGAEPDVITLAQRAHAAFPNQPLLGTDIVRDAESHALFLLECNPRGDAWLMSSDTGRKIEDANGIIFAGQYGALQIAAGVLIRETRRRLSSRIFAQLGSEPVP